MPPKKKVAGLIKLQIQAGQATPAPPVGPALGQHGVNIMEFCKQYNAATETQRGNVIPVEITVYEDRTFTFVTKTPPAAPRRAACRRRNSGVVGSNMSRSFYAPLAARVNAAAAPWRTELPRQAGCRMTIFPAPARRAAA